MAHSNDARPQPSRAKHRALTLLMFASIAVSGCSIAIPIAGFGGSGDEDITGSITPADTKPFAPNLDSEDWRRAQAALATALDPQGNGERVAWDNPQSGRRGMVRPTGITSAEGNRLCRLFDGRTESKEGAYHVEGRACRNKAGEWSIDWSSNQKRG